ncbi:S1 family peptidase [Dietzia timorensis]|uniref:Uncharacterized protein n=1 Tax=Dietzia timorensis TaxID=499555 RepID=A0A173LJP8_9ACTN|nr:S1 family peptidase [Dietzia timorensis]ANI91864.1 Hypothetical protein BJL86_1072 [Dietzia timorensis]
MRVTSLRLIPSSARALWAMLFAVALVGSLLTSATAFAPNAQAQEARPVLGGGTPLLFDGGKALCTATASGWDNANRAIVFTAGHCSSAVGEAVEVPGAGTTGHVVARNEILDYSVVQVDPNKVTLVRQAGVADRGAPPNQGDNICKLGASTGLTCGPTWQVADNTIYSQVCAGRGDSGGPVMNGDRLVGMLNGGTMPPLAQDAGVGSVGNVLPECFISWQHPFFLPAYGTTFDAIVNDVAARNWPGTGFRMA